MNFYWLIWHDYDGVYVEQFSFRSDMKRRITILERKAKSIKKCYGEKIDACIYGSREDPFQKRI